MNEPDATHDEITHPGPSGPRQINRYRCMNRIGSNSNPLNKTPVSNRNYLAMLGNTEFSCRAEGPGAAFNSWVSRRWRWGKCCGGSARG